MKLFLAATSIISSATITLILTIALMNLADITHPFGIAIFCFSSGALYGWIFKRFLDNM